MKKEISIAPENSLILIMDRTIGEIPETMNGVLVASTDSCIAIGTLCSIDGETLITLSNENVIIEGNKLPIFDNILNTPSKMISVCTVLNKAILEMEVKESRTRVQIQVNHSSEPDNIRIVVT